ncbi:MAG: hypothetical protein HQL14_08190 [Candidatus Omnitrophica bacterium]|nr:hypothetical protein [Candidatus Omnitrophota bacterium]
MAAIIGLSYFSGLGIVTQIFTTLWIFGIPITFLTVSTILAVLLGAGIINNPLLVQDRTAVSGSNISMAEKFISAAVIIYITINIIIVFMSALSLPVFAWDSITSEAYKAKTVFYTGSLTQLSQAFYPNFPFYTLTAMTWGMFGQGVWDDQYMHLIFALAFLAFTFIFFDVARVITSRLIAYIALLLLFSSNLLIIHSTLSYRDVFMMAHTSICLIGILLWGHKGNDRFIIFSAIFCALSLLTKLEGLPYFPVYLLMILLTGVLYRKTFKNIFNALIRFLCISFIIYFPFQIFKFTVGAGDGGWAAHVVGREGPMMRFAMISERFYNELFLWGNWNILFWPMVMISSLILLVVYRKDKLGVLLLISILFFFSVYWLTFFCTGSFNSIRADWCSISRYFMHFYPLAVLLISRVLFLTYESR